MGATADAAASGDDGSLGAAGSPPDDIVLAARLMYVGATLSALLGLMRAVDPDTFRDTVTASGSMSGDSQLAGYVMFAFVTAGMWLLVAWGCRRGRRWFRVAGTLFGAFYVVTTVVALFQVPLNLATVVSVVMAAVAAAVLWLLWRPESSRWFAGGVSGANLR